MRNVLTLDQIKHATTLGHAREYSAIRQGRRGTNGAPSGRQSLTNHINGAMAEEGFNRLFPGLTWFEFAESGFWNRPDFMVGNLKIDVKALVKRNYRLLLQLDTPDDVIYPLVYIGELPWVELVGWISGREAKQPQYRDEPQAGRPCYALPVRALRPVHELETIISQHKGKGSYHVSNDPQRVHKKTECSEAGREDHLPYGTADGEPQGSIGGPEGHQRDS